MTEMKELAREGVLVLAFPGQGSLSPGVGEPWRDTPAYRIVEEISASSGVDVSTLLCTGTAEEIVSTDRAQLCTFALSLCVLEATGLTASGGYAIGHSLGEYSALVAAGMLDRPAATRLVAARGEAMRAASAASPGGLAALLGAGEDVAERACKEVGELWIANLNGPGQVVVGGPLASLDRLERGARELGIRRVIRLKVDGAFHTPLMAPAADALSEVLAGVRFATGVRDVVANVDAAVHTDPAEWPGLLVRQLTEPVRFDAAVRSLPTGARVVECGPGKVLSGLIARIREDLVVHSVGVPGDLGALGVGR